MSSSKRAALGTVVLSWLALSAAAPAPPAIDRHLERARVCLAALDYECADAELAEARALTATATSEQKIATLWASAELSLALGESRAADQHLDGLVAASPAATAPKAWPSAWQAALQRAHERAPDRSPPTLTPRTSETEVVAGEDTVLEVDASDKSGVARVRAFVVGANGVTELPMVTGDSLRWRATIAGSDVMPPVVRYWIEATDRAGNGPARLGSQARPLELPVRDIPVAHGDDSILETWWFWTAVGVVVAGSAVAVGLTLDDAPSAAAPAFGGVRVELVGPQRAGQGRGL